MNGYENSYRIDHRNTTSVLISDGMSLSEVGDVLSDATEISLIDDTYCITEKIGNGVNGTKDVDMYKFVVTTDDIGKIYVMETSIPTGSGMTKVDTYLLAFSIIWGHKSTITMTAEPIIIQNLYLVLKR
jgi:hypothetical protein